MSEQSSLQRALDVVSLVALRGELTVREIGAALNLPKSTAHRLVGSLVRVRLLEVHHAPDSDVYAVGKLVEELNAGQLSWRSLLQHARIPLETLRDQTGETVGLHILYSERRVLLEQAVSWHSHRWVYNNLMVPMPLHGGAAAKMLLALLPVADMERLAARDHRPRASDESDTLVSFVQGLQSIRENDVSVTADEVNSGVASIAVPVIRDTHYGYPLAVLSLAAPSIRLSNETFHKLLPMLRKTAQQIAQISITSARGATIPRNLIVGVGGRRIVSADAPSYSQK